MKGIVIAGLGSMGRRRARILRGLFGQAVRLYGVDMKPERRDECRKLYGMTVVPGLENLPQNGEIEAAFICVPPLLHASAIHRCLKNGWNVFAELNLVKTGYEENLALARQKGCVLFLSSTMLYRREVEYMVSMVRESKENLCYVYHVGQYLADWHPWDELKTFFASQKESNGCRELFAIELPWIVDAFGDVERIRCMSGRQTLLPIEYDDNYLVLMEHKSGHKGVLAVDVVSPVPERELRIYGEHAFLKWDGTPEGLLEMDSATKKLRRVHLYDGDSVERRDGYGNGSIVENAYAEEVKEFFSVLSGEREARYSFEKDASVLTWIDRIEACCV